jgi:hypothetical protein
MILGNPDTLIGGTIIHDHHLGWRMGLCGQCIEAGGQIGSAVPAHDGHADRARLAHDFTQPAATGNWATPAKANSSCSTT